MGLYDPTEDKTPVEDGSPVQINSHSTATSNSNSNSWDDTLKSAVSKTNDFTVDKINKLSSILDSKPPEHFPKSLDDLNNLILNTPFFKTGGSIGSLFSGLSTDFKTNEFLTYPIPTPELYDNCKKINGLAAWDEDGYWHCLFPKKIIPNQTDGHLLSKEDVENDKGHKFGYYFTNFNDLMTWKMKMKNLSNEKRAKDWEDWKNSERAKWSSITGGNSDDTNLTSKSSITGSSYNSTIKTLDNGDVEKTTVIKKLFDDGRTENKEIKELWDAKTGESKIIEEKDI